ncbi:MAG: trehalase family glycosidase [Cyclobacteriaceae bacterium]
MNRNIIIAISLVYCACSCQSPASKDPKREFHTRHVAQPVWEERPDMVEFYWTAWRQAWDHVLYQDGVVQSPYMDEGLWLNTIWIWDTEFMAMYCKYAYNLYPGVESLDNFYGPILNNKASSLRIHHPDNPPFYAWVEAESFKFTNDYNRIERLINDDAFLPRYYNWFNQLKKGKQLEFNHSPIEAEFREIGFLWEGNPSGMDNTPRGREQRPQILWVDALAQQALSALYIHRLAVEVENQELSETFKAEYERIKKMINTYYWDEEDGFYYDILESDHSFVKVKTPASYWVMLAEIPSKEQAARMVEYAKSPDFFGGKAPWVSVSRSDQDFNGEYGDYWRGAIWIPTAYMATKALELYGYQELANDLSYNLVTHMLKTYYLYRPHTIWECYSPNKYEPSFRVRKEGLEEVREDFCGWSALAPISLFIENVLGFYEVNAQTNVVRWNKHLRGIHGIKNLKFGNVVTDIVGDDATVTVRSNSDYMLYINKKPYKISKGKNEFTL